MSTSPPLVAFAGTTATAPRATGLLAALGVDVDVVSWHRLRSERPDAVPDAIVASTVGALDGLPEVPTAVWVDRPESLHRAHAAGVEMVLTRRMEMVDHGAVLVPSVGVAVDRWPPLAPLVRRRWRDHLGLDEQMVSVVDPAEDDDDRPATLAVAAAAVVTGPPVALALALGCPVVTNESSARRLGLRAGVEVEVADGPHAALSVARQIAADEPRAAVLSRRGRRFAERHLDLSHPAAVVRRRLGLARPALCAASSSAAPVAANLGDPLGRFEDRLSELATAPSAVVRDRSADALALFRPDPAGGPVR